MTKEVRIKFLSLSILLGVVFLFLSLLVNKDIFHDIDYDTLVGLQAKVGRVVDLPFSLLTLLGSSEVTLFITGAIFLVIFWKKKYLFTGIFLIFLIYFFELAGKILIYHPKPPVIFNRYALNIFFPSSFVVHTNYSFPSGHMARIAFLVVIILFLIFSFTKNKLRRTYTLAISILFIIFMFVSRIYLGEHWLSDVIGGLLLGASLATLAIGLW